MFRAAVAAVDPRRLVRGRLRLDGGRLLLLGRDGRVLSHHAGPLYVVAAGKAAVPMARGALDSLAPRGARARRETALDAPALDAPALEMSGDGVAPRGATGRLRGIRVRAGGHPVPTRESLLATAAVWSGVRRAPSKCLVLVLLSGGASALLVKPPRGVSLRDKGRVSAELLACGASIEEMNVVRKHLSVVKGGGLARHAGARPLWSLILSDVVGDDPATIGSGPTAPDPSTFAEALSVVRRYRLEGRLPESVKLRLREGARGRIAETPKAKDPCFRSVTNVVVGNNRTALEAVASRAVRLGFSVVVRRQPICGDTTEAAVRFARSLRRLQRRVQETTCVVAGGETTVHVRGGGVGGRNQEFALVVAREIDGLDGVDLLSAGTDGIDGPTDAAGALIGARTMRAAREKGLNIDAALARNDSYTFLSAAGGLFRPGPTGTNVMDLKVALITPARGAAGRGRTRG